MTEAILTTNTFTPVCDHTHCTCHTYTDFSGYESPTDTPPPDETQSSSPPAAKWPALSSTQDCGDVASFVGTRITNADQRYNLLNNHFKLITVFQSMQMGVPFSFNGSNGILGLCIVGRRMVAFVFPVFFLLRVVTMGPIQVYLSAVL